MTRALGEPPKWIEIELTGQFARGLESLKEALGWRIREEDGRRLVCLQERYEGRAPRGLVPGELVHARDAGASSSYDALRSWPPQDHYLSMWNELSGMVVRLQETGKPAGVLAAFQLAAASAPDRMFPDQIKAFFEALSTDLPDARLRVAMFDQSFAGRLAAIRGLFAAAHTPEILTRRPFQGFPASRGLVSDIVSGLGSYVAPILLGRTPWIVGVNAARGSGLLILNFGRPLEGVEDLGYSGIYQLFVPSRYLSRARLDLDRVTDSFQIAAHEVDEAILWWLERLDGLLGHLVDPANFPGRDGIYDPAKHFGFMLTMDRLAATMAGILSYELVDQFTRKMFLFDALDLLAGLGFGDYKKTLSLKRVEHLLERLEQRLPAPVRTLILERCSRAVGALKDMQHGFFLTERISNDQLSVNSDKGKATQIPLESAVAQYLRLVRNSSHSFLQDIQKPFQLSILASHNGDIPSSLADLPLLYFLDLLTEPLKILRPRMQPG